MKILIAIPTYESIYPDTFKSIYDMDKGSHEVDFNFFRGYDVARARNLIAKATLEGSYTYVLMVDNDVTVPRDALTNLLEGNPDIAVGYCLSRSRKAGPNTTGRTTAFQYGAKTYDKENAYTVGSLLNHKANGTNRLRIRGSGLACALINRRVFQGMKYPYFKWTEYADGGQLSEDLGFCEKVQTEIYVDTRVGCGHMMRYVQEVST